VPTLAEAVHDPSRLRGLPLASLVEFVHQLAALQTVVAAEIALVNGTVNGNGTAPRGSDDGDVLLDVNEASVKTGLSKGALYRGKNLPFRIQAGPATVRFSSRGSDKWIQAKRIRL